MIRGAGRTLVLVFKSPVAASPTPRPQRRLTKTAEEMAEEAEELEALVAGVRRELQVTLHACRRVFRPAYKPAGPG